MPASNKVGTQLLVSPHVRDTARALAIVRRESVAEIWRTALEPALEQAAAREPAMTEIYQLIKNTVLAAVIEATAPYHSVAEIYRDALEPAVDALASRHAPHVERLDEAFAHMGVDRSAALEAMLKQKIRYADLFEPGGQPKSRFPGTIG